MQPTESPQLQQPRQNSLRSAFPMQTPGMGHVYTVNQHMAKNTSFAGPHMRNKNQGGATPNAAQTTKISPVEHY